MLRYDRAGALSWSYVADGTIADHAYMTHVAIDQELIFAAGVLQGTVSFGNGPLTSAGEQDALLARFSAHAPPPLE